MTNPQTPVAILLHYLLNDATKIIYYSTELPEDQNNLILLGSSDNPNPKAAAAFFMQQGKVKKGFSLRNLDDPT
jgi:hypothetical protein